MLHSKCIRAKVQGVTNRRADVSAQNDQNGHAFASYMTIGVTVEKQRTFMEMGENLSVRDERAAKISGKTLLRYRIIHERSAFLETIKHMY